MPITIRDLAKKLNLSITTVSRALDGYSDVSENTRTRVIQAAQGMGYAPSSAARQLRRRHADAIGYILPTSSPRFSDPFYSDFLAGLCDEAAEHKIDLVVSSSPPDSDFEKIIYRRWFQSMRVDGIVLNRIRIQDWRIDYLSENKVPFVTLGRISSNQNSPYITVNERGGFERLIAHLAEKGHTRIAYIGAFPNLMVHVERLAGYKQGLERSGLAYDEKMVIEGDLTEEGGYNAAKILFNRSVSPTAVIGCNDLTAIGVLKAAQELGFQVGKDLAVAGYDGIRETAFTSPPITTLYQPTYEIAARLAAMLISLAGGNTIENPQVVLEPEMILRSSTESCQ
ncbi:MAG: LacI family DNA-binding transcriptional regulator [Anaerolineaceae bacterium]|nr:LacI family DNA-binding transcriptional regulator [Anaerolineaceae bacterium]